MSRAQNLHFFHVFQKVQKGEGRSMDQGAELQDWRTSVGLRGSGSWVGCP